MRGLHPDQSIGWGKHSSKGAEVETNPVPCHAGDATNGLVCKLAESRRGEVEVSEGATRAAISDRDSDGFALVVSGDLLVADGVVIGVCTIVAGEDIKEKVRNGSDVVGSSVGDAASAETRGVVCALASLSANEE